jgi:hypothetical protein
MLIEMADARLNGTGIESRTVQGVKIGYQTGIRNDPQCEIFVRCDFLVNAGTDQNRVAERTVQPWRVRALYSATEKDNHPFDDDFQDSSDGPMNGP